MRNKPTYENLSDAEIWKAFMKGSQEAFSYIFEQHIRLLYNYGDKISPNHALVDDCIQELFIDLWEKRNQLNPTSSIKFYLFVALRRKILRKLSQSKENPHALVPENLEVVQSYESQLIDLQITEDQKIKLQEALKSLSEKQRTATLLKFYHKLNYEEIAEMMSLPVKSVYDLIYHSIKTLKKSLPKKTFYLIFIIISWIYLFL